MAQQKLYTEEQVRQAMQESRYAFSTDKGYDEIVQSLTPIELPSDEEIARVALEETSNINEQILFNNGAIYICKLIEKQIIKQNK